MSQQGDEVFDELESMAVGQREHDLTAIYITSERLRRWCTTTKEGKLISNMLIMKHEEAIKDFTRCDLNDVDAMQKARLEIEVTKRIFEMFQSVYQEGDIAQSQLESGE